jgi:hypothetical protein
MGSQRPVERLVRCDSIGLALPRVRSTPHNIGGFRLTVISAKKTRTR